MQSSHDFGSPAAQSRKADDSLVSQAKETDQGTRVITLGRQIMPPPAKWIHDAVRIYRELKLVGALTLPPNGDTATQLGSSDLIVSMTSHPARIRHAWRSIETILRQSTQPGLTVLVLAEEEFPRRELPRKLRIQQRRGLEILWVGRNGRSFDKLLPARKFFPNSHIITVDDDLYFPPNLVSSLWSTALMHPGTIIGARGWRVLPTPSDDEVHFGTGWVRAEPGDSGSGLHLPGGNGCLYPPNSLDAEVDNLDLALRLAPTNDDIWFWIHAIRAGSNFVCLGMGPHLQVGPQRGTYALSKVNRVGQEAQFRAVVSHFSLDPKTLCWAG